MTMQMVLVVVRLCIGVFLLPVCLAGIALRDLIERILSPSFAPPAEHKKKVVLITGASSGIGRSAALHLAKLGYVVFAGFRRMEDGESLSAEHDHIQPIQLDVMKQNHIENARATIADYIKSNDAVLAAVVNNAGVVFLGTFEDRLQETVTTMNVNLIASLHVTHAFLPLLREHRARVINIGSVSGRVPVAFWSGYVASKWALRGWSLSLRNEMMHLGVSVSLIEPGFVETRLLEFDVAESSPAYKTMARFACKYLVPVFTSALMLSPTSVTDRSIEHAIRSWHPRASYLPTWDAVACVAVGSLPTSLAPDAAAAQLYHLLKQ